MIFIPLQTLDHAHDLPTPSYATKESAGVDLMAAIESDLMINPNERILIPTGIAIALPSGYEAQIRSRSGLSFKNGIIVANAPGTIDSDYRGEIKVVLGNISTASFTISRGMRIAQMVIAQYTQVSFQNVKSLDETERNCGGFGSTGYH